MSGVRSGSQHAGSSAHAVTVTTTTAGTCHQITPRMRDTVSASSAGLLAGEHAPARVRRLTRQEPDDAEIQQVEVPEQLQAHQPQAVLLLRRPWPAARA